MGVIQNSLNQAMATIAGGIFGIQHIVGNETSELLKLKEEQPVLEKEIAEKKAEADQLEADVDKYKQGQYKAYLNGDDKNPVWVDRSNDEAEYNMQKDMAMKALKSAQNEILNKGTRGILMDNRIKQLSKKYEGGVAKEVSNYYELDTKKKEKPNKRGGTF